MKTRNPLLATDVYKIGHMEQYIAGTNKVYSYLTARSDKHFSQVKFFGLKYYIQEYISAKLEPWMADEFIYYAEKILGKISDEIKSKVHSLCDLGYFPLEIKSVKEGEVYPVRNVLLTITNTLPEFYWVVGFIESVILKLWFPITVASCSYKYKLLSEQYAKETVDDRNIQSVVEFSVHDFGYRGDTSEESAILSGGAHLLNFKGSDTIPAYKFMDTYYPEMKAEMYSVPASEHSVMCSFGRDNEFAAFENMLNLYPTGIVSIVSDTYDIYKVVTEFLPRLKNKILSREGKVVIRPDSGNPEHIICGDPVAIIGSPQCKGVVRLLDEEFGHTINSKGYKVLNEKVGLIYGDGMFYERYERTLNTLKQMGYASSNLVIGIGGILRYHSRDTLGFALKATYIEVYGESKEIEKDPITDQKKKSHKGLLSLKRDLDGSYRTFDQCTWQEEKESILETVYIK